jgi:uncharacterized protein
MKNKIFIIAAVIAVVMAAGFAGCATTSAETSTPAVTVNMNNDQGIWVSGEGKLTVVPDIATINMGVYAENEKVVDAQSEAAQAIENVMNVLTSNGIEEKDIKTTHYSISQVTRWDNIKQESVVTGYRVSNMISVKIRDVEKAGAVIDAVTAAAGDNTRINGISFSVDNPEQYYAEAREKAVEDAEAKAEQMAQLTGVELGKPVYITENSSSPVYPYPVYREYDMAAGEAVPTAISAGETDIVLNVQINYAIK